MFRAVPCSSSGGQIVLLQLLVASPDMLPFSLCNKTCNSAHEQTPLSNDTIDSVLRHREVGRAKDLAAPSRTVNLCCVRLNKCSLFNNKHKGMSSTKITMYHLIHVADFGFIIWNIPRREFGDN